MSVSDRPRKPLRAIQAADLLSIVGGVFSAGKYSSVSPRGGTSCYKPRPEKKPGTPNTQPYRTQVWTTWTCGQQGISPPHVSSRTGMGPFTMIGQQAGCHCNSASSHLQAGLLQRPSLLLQLDDIRVLHTKGYSVLQLRHPPRDMERERRMCPQNVSAGAKPWQDKGNTTTHTLPSTGGARLKQRQTAEDSLVPERLHDTVVGA